MRKQILALLLSAVALSASGQVFDDNQFTADGYTNSTMRQKTSDSIQSQHKEIPRGIHVWTVDERFGDRHEAEIDTMTHMFQNTVFTDGLRGEYNNLGNGGSPRINRIFIDRLQGQQFSFLEPYDFFVEPVSRLHFTNTLSPITNLSYNTCGNRTNGEDRFKALFAVNAGKKFGVGAKFDYLYARGYYDSQSTSHTNFTLWASYLGERYDAHFIFSNNHQKVAENGGITDDNYISHPEMFNDNFAEDEIPTVMEQNWNRNDNQHLFFTHRYNVGFRRKVPMTKDEIEARKFAIAAAKENQAAKAKETARKKAMTEGADFDEEEYDRQQRSLGRPDDAKIAGDLSAAEESAKPKERVTVDNAAVQDSLLAIEVRKDSADMWMKYEYVPVTSFIHTAKFDNYRRIYEAYQTPDQFYANQYYNVGELTGDSIYDVTKAWSLKNTLAIATLEGFSKWAKAGLKVFASYDLRHFSLPDSLGGTTGYNEHNLSIGGQLSKTRGRTLHYNVTGEYTLAGEDAGNVAIDGGIDLNFPLFGDTVRLDASGFFHMTNPTFYYRHFHARHFWWDNDLDKTMHSRIEGKLTIGRTRTTLRAAVDELKNYAYLSQSYSTDPANNLYRYGVSAVARQQSSPINLLTLQLAQNFRFGILNWQSVLTYQRSSDEDVLPVPAFNAYTNLFIRFKIAHVLKCDLGGDVRYFSSYYAPSYSVGLGQYAVQGGDNRAKTGNYPWINVYANFHLQHTRFFIMYSHVNASAGKYFLTPHYPTNGSVLRFGLSWNFFN